jgi:hypothetical protein
MIMFTTVRVIVDFAAALPHSMIKLETSPPLKNLKLQIFGEDPKPCWVLTD